MLLTEIELPTESQYRDYQNFIQNELGLSLGDDKAYLLHGRLQRRMGELGLDNYADYFQMLAADQEGQERQRFFNAITTTKTDFYREKEHFDWLVREIYPELREKISRSELAKIRLWSAGCSFGQEAYSLALDASEFFAKELSTGMDLKILATDVNTEALNVAQRGQYAAETLNTLPERFRDRHFRRINSDQQDLYQISKSAGSLIDFRRLNFLQLHYPIETRFQVIFCRNVFYYFDPKLRQAVLKRLAGYLEEGGWLVLSLTEIGYQVDGLTKVRGEIFRRQPD